MDITGNPFVKSYEPTVNGLSIYKATTIQATTLIQIEWELLSVESEPAILLNALVVYCLNQTVNQSRYQCIDCYAVNLSRYQCIDCYAVN